MKILDYLNDKFKDKVKITHTDHDTVILDLSGNNFGNRTINNRTLRIIFNSIGNLSNLESLYLIDTNLGSIDDNETLKSIFAIIGNLSNLEILSLYKNNLSSIYNNENLKIIFASIGKLSNLNYLSLSTNNLGNKDNATLTSIFNSIDNLSNLNNLDLNDNYNVAQNKIIKETLPNVNINF
jgi:Leucine-rich repeat (LRR) protein